VIATDTIILHDNKTGQWLCFENPVVIYQVYDQTELLDTLNKIEESVHEKNLYAAGFLSYEAAQGINPVLSTQSSSAFPLCWFGLYQAPRIVDAPVAARVENKLHWEPSVSAEQYYDALSQIHRNIRDGETYQVNYSYRLHAEMSSDPWSLFASMVTAQGNGYGAFVELADWSICSVSPELFFALENEALICRPMKGTVARGLTLATDRERQDWLLQSSKNRAENLMIVDMVRNDLGQIATTGTVETDSLFNIEKYPTVWQMTSKVHCQTQSGLSGILQALYPAASITGAPKKHTMEIIRDLECSPRNIYTGTIGYYTPDRQAQFNVAIRTVLVDKHRQRAEYGVGGGIVWDSEQKIEFSETHSKASVLTFFQPEFSLLETLRWSPDQNYWLLEYHLQRLRESAEYFSRQCDEVTLMRQLENLAAGFSPEPYRVRVLLDRNGEFKINTDLIKSEANPARISLAKQNVNSGNVFLYHKTTHRQVYTDALTASPGYNDVLLWNERGEITETCIANIVVELRGQYYTPPVSCGLLAGTYRAQLLQEGKILERVIFVDELSSCTGFYLINSVRGWWEVELVF